jgi:hypothetical protein
VKPSENDQACVNAIHFLSVDMVKKADLRTSLASHGRGARGLRAVDTPS